MSTLPIPANLFPDNPVVGQTVTAPDGRTWRWDGERWVLISGGGGGGTTAQTPWLSEIDGNRHALINVSNLYSEDVNVADDLITHGTIYVAEHGGSKTAPVATFLDDGVIRMPTTALIDGAVYIGHFYETD